MTSKDALENLRITSRTRKYIKTTMFDYESTIEDKEQEWLDIIAKDLEVLDVLYDFLEDSVYGWNPKKETWGWIEFNLDIEKDDNRAEEKKKLQEWIIKTHKENENDK